MRFRFANKKLEALYTAEAGARKYPRAVVTAFFEVMAMLDAAVDERDLYAVKSLHFEALKGDRAGQHSIRLNKQFRLILRIETDEDGNVVVLIEIDDYH
ncbi:MAG: type II toxin-antitoxin system RelE/ParE family toxin [Polyangiaceae bacterium]|nr:type II toxin-antitoxin system RelE/ParE family toxin [Polyangiaceae bacterium]